MTYHITRQNPYTSRREYLALTTGPKPMAVWLTPAECFIALGGSRAKSLFTTPCESHAKWMVHSLAQNDCPDAKATTLAPGQSTRGSVTILRDHLGKLGEALNNYEGRLMTAIIEMAERRELPGKRINDGHVEEFYDALGEALE